MDLVSYPKLDSYGSPTYILRIGRRGQSHNRKVEIRDKET